MPPSSSQRAAQDHPARRLLRPGRRPATWSPTPSSPRSTTRTANGNNVESHYAGKGGVQLSSLFKRAAFALRLGDFNLLISDQITDQSRIMFVRDPVAMAQKAAPFLTFDHDPYAGDQRTATSTGSSTGTRRPTSTPTRRTPTPSRWRSGAACPSSYNYVRNSVKVVIDAYSGKMTFYDVDPNDPILQAYAAAFPHMFTPLSKMPAELQAHLRYPEDIFSIQSAIYGRYHLTEPGRLLRGEQRLAALADGGRRAQVPGAAGREHLQLPGPAGLDHPGPHGAAVPGVLAAGNTTSRSSRSSNAFVPAAQSSSTNNNQNFNLTAFMVGQSDPGHYGPARRLRDAAGHDRPGQRRRGDLGQQDGVVGHLAAGPERVRGAAGRDADGADRQLDGVPAAPLRVADDQPPAPAQVRGRGAGQGRPDRHVALGRPHRHSGDGRHAALDRGRGEHPGSTGGTVPAAVAAYLAQAQTDYQNALTALKAQNLAGYQSDIEAMSAALTAAQNLLPASGRPRRRRPRRRRARRPSPEGDAQDGEHATTTSSTTSSSARRGDDDVDHHASTTSNQPGGGGRRRPRSPWSRRSGRAGG